MIREVILYKQNFIEFYQAQDSKVQQKIEFVLDLVRFEKNVPTKFFKKLRDSNGIYEIIIVTTFKSIRVLCFLDAGRIVVLTNCFVKKSQKTPKREIYLAQKLKEEYLNKKYRGK